MYRIYLLGLVILAALSAMASEASADEFFKCTQQTKNPIKLRLMSAGMGSVIVKKTKDDKFVLSTEEEAILNFMDRSKK